MPDFGGSDVTERKTRRGRKKGVDYQYVFAEAGHGLCGCGSVIGSIGYRDGALGQTAPVMCYGCVVKKKGAKDRDEVI